MKKFDELLEVAAILNGPEGCAWDRKQTFTSLQPYVLEEAHEVLEAVDSDVDDKIIEELGDLFYTVIFYAKVAQKQGRFGMEEILQGVIEKLVRRHPHVFGDQKIETEEELEKNWEKIKSTEKGKEQRVHAFEGIPPTMPIVAKAQKILSIIKKSSFPLFGDRLKKVYSEKDLGQEFLHLVWQAEQNGLDAETCMRRALTQLELQFLDRS
jgi:MazG family protein